VAVSLRRSSAYLVVLGTDFCRTGQPGFMSSQSLSLSLTLRDSWKRLSRVKTAEEGPALVPSDETLMALVQKGDHKAFEELFDRFYVTVRGIARGVLRSSDDVADVVQEAFLDIFENLLSRMVQTWGEIPLAFLQHLGIKKRLYGYIGTKDFTLHPFIPPGSLVQIDDRDTRIQSRGWETNFDRPIYFLQLREGFACGWCQVDGGNLSIIPFSASRLAVRRFHFPGDVDVVGRVTGVAMSLTSHHRKVVSNITDRTA